MSQLVGNDRYGSPVKVGDTIAFSRATSSFIDRAKILSIAPSGRLRLLEEGHTKPTSWEYRSYRCLVLGS